MSFPQRITCPHCQGSMKAPPLAPGSPRAIARSAGKAFRLPGKHQRRRAPARPATSQVAKPQAAAPPSPARLDLQHSDQSHLRLRPSNYPSTPPPIPPRSLPIGKSLPLPSLSPPPPKPVEIPVVCNVCGTRMYAKESPDWSDASLPRLLYQRGSEELPRSALLLPRKKRLPRWKSFSSATPASGPLTNR